jgi:hypothetical protein
VALWALSGATTTTVPISDITAINALIPGAKIPSSLVTRIKGLVFFSGDVFKIIFLNFQNSGSYTNVFSKQRKQN